MLVRIQTKHTDQSSERSLSQSSAKKLSKKSSFQRLYGGKIAEIKQRETRQLKELAEIERDFVAKIEEIKEAQVRAIELKKSSFDICLILDLTASMKPWLTESIQSFNRMITKIRQ